MLWAGKNNNASELPDLKLEGFRTIVRPARPSDYPQWQTIREANKARLKPLEPRWAKDSLSEGYFERRLKRQAQDWRGDRAYCFVVAERQSDELIGGMNLNHVCRGAAQCASLGYWIDEAREGQGFMSEAGRMVIEYSFNTLRLHRINAACLPENERSRKLLSKLGFAEEGFAKAYYQINGDWKDHILYGLVRSD